MELEWSVTLRVEIGSWKRRHPVRLMLESNTWDGLGSNPHPTHKGKQLAKNSETLSTPKLWVLLRRGHAWRGPTSAQGCGTVL